MNKDTSFTFVFLVSSGIVLVPVDLRNDDFLGCQEYKTRVDSLEGPQMFDSMEVSSSV